MNFFISKALYLSRYKKNLTMTYLNLTGILTAFVLFFASNTISEQNTSVRHTANKNLYSPNVKISPPDNIQNKEKTENLTLYDEMHPFDGDTIPPDFDIDTALVAKVKAVVCNADIVVPSIKNLSDDTDPAPKWWVTSDQGTIYGDENNNGFVDSLEEWEIKYIPLGDHEICYHAIDDSGNESTECMHLIVLDSMPPIPVCDQYKQISISDDGIGKINVLDFDSGSFDNCNPIHFKVLRVNNDFEYDGGCISLNGDDNPATGISDVWYDDEVYFCCDDIDHSFLVQTIVFDKDPGLGPVDPERMKLDGDLYGHYSDCWTVVQVECHILPVLNCSPVVLSCDESLDPDENKKLIPDFNYACGFELEYNDVYFGVDTLGFEKILRKWTLNLCSNKDSCAQLIVINPNEEFNPCDIIFPPDSISDCGKVVNHRPEWNKFVCSPVTTQIIRQDTFYDNEGNYYKMEREWAVIDSTLYQPGTGAENNIDSVIGNKLDCSKLIEDGYYRYTQTLIPEFDPCSIVFPSDVADACDGYGIPQPVWDESTCANIYTKIINEDTFTGQFTKIIREWAVINKSEYREGSGAEDNVDMIIDNKLDCSELVKDGYYKYTQVIIFDEDRTSPVFEIEDTIVAYTNSYSCSSEIPIPEIIDLKDYCDADPKWWITIDSVLIYGDANENGYVDSTEIWYLQTYRNGVFSITYHAIDNAGNEAQKQAVLNIIDDKRPIAVCKQYDQKNLTALGYGLMEAIDLDAGSFDNCNPVFYKVTRIVDDNEDDGYCNEKNGDDNPATDEIEIWYDDEVFFCCQDLNKEIPVILRVFDKDPGDGPVDPKRMKAGGDLYGHYNVCWTKILVECKIPPLIDCTPVTVHCGESYNPDINPNILPAAFSVCGHTLSYQDSLVNPGDYSGTFTRVWTVSSNGYSAKCEQAVTIDTSRFFDPCTIIFPKSDTILGCTDITDSIPIWDNSGCPNVTYEIQNEDTLFYTGDLCMQIIRDWAVIDWDTYQADPDGADYNIDSIVGNKLDCSNLVADGFYRYTQIISIFDFVPPKIFVEDTCFSIDDCYAYDIRLEARATDECSNEKINWKYIVTNMDTWETVQYSYNYIPVPITGVKGKKSKDNLDNTTDASLLLLNPLPKGNYRVTWTAGGLCGSANSKNHYFTINDNKAPVPVIVDIASVDLTNGKAEISAIQFDKGGCGAGCILSNDNCTSKEKLLFTFTDKLPRIWEDMAVWQSQLQQYGVYYFDPATGLISTKERYIDGLADAFDPTINSSMRIIVGFYSGNVPTRIYVWDEFAENKKCDNNNYEFADIIIILQYNGNKNVFGNVNYINSEKGFTGMTMKASNYEITATDITLDGDYSLSLPEGKFVITGNNNENYTDYISALDLILLNRYLLGLYSSFDLRGIWAMDANADGKAKASDYIQILDVLLRKKDKFDNDSWIAISKKYNYHGQNDLKNELLKALRDTVIMENNNSIDNVDFYALKIGDVDLSSQFDTIEKFEPDMELWIGNDTIDKNSGSVVPVYCGGIDDIAGMQFELDLGNMTLDSIISGLIIRNHINYNVVGNKLLLIWTNIYNGKFEKDDVLFSLKLKANAQTELKNELKFSKDLLKPEAYTGDHIKTHNINFNVKETVAVNDIPEEEIFVLYQNKPNPFDHNTKIGFKSDIISDYVLTIYDLTGKEIKKYKGISHQGYNVIDIDEKEIPFSGVAFYRLEIAGYTGVKKMIKL